MIISKIITLIGLPLTIFNDYKAPPREYHSKPELQQ